MNSTRSKYFYQIFHFIAGHPENLNNVNEAFLRQLEEEAGIQEKDVYCWRHMVYSDYIKGLCSNLDEKMGHILRDRGCV